jgi:ABC-type amino acid transport substrate-binding protein
MHRTTSTYAFGPRRLRAALCCALVSAAAVSSALAAGTLDRIRDSGRIGIGYVANSQPYSYTDPSGKVTGYAIAICRKVADSLKADLKLSALNAEFVPVSMEDRFSAVEQGKIDLLCGAAPTLGRRAQVDFSIPIGFTGTGVVIRSDAPVRLVQVLTGRVSAQINWRGAQAPERRGLAVVAGTTIERALADVLAQQRIAVNVVSVKDTAEGLKAVADRRVDGFFDSRAALLEGVDQSPSRADLVVLDRLFRRDLIALSLRRGDDDFRLAVDRALSQLFRSDDLAVIYRTHLKEPDSETLEFFKLVALPE